MENHVDRVFRTISKRAQDIMTAGANYLEFDKTITRRKEEVPRPQWEPGVEAGYRLPYQPWGFYFKSFFKLHNETGNIWTHFLAAIFFVVLIYQYSFIVDFTQRESWPMLVLGFTSLCTALGSSMGHLFHSKSAYVHYVAMSFDFTGVALYSFGSFTIVLYYSSDDDVLKAYGKYLMPLNAFLALFDGFGCCHGNTKYSLHHHLRRKMWYFIPLASHYFACLIPPLIRFSKVKSWVDQPAAELESYNAHMMYFAVFSLGSIFFFSHIPELIFPGKFDLLFHSHQIWHYFGPATIYYQFKASHFDLKHRRRNPEALAQLPSAESLWLYLLGLIIAFILCILYVAHEAKKVVEREGLEIPRKKIK